MNNCSVSEVFEGVAPELKHLQRKASTESARSKSLRERVTLATNTCSGIRQSYIIVRIALEYAFGAEYASPITKNSLCSKGVVHFSNSEARVQ